MSTEDNTRPNSAAISSKQAQGRPPSTLTVKNQSINFALAYHHIQKAYQGYYAKPLAYALGVKRTRVYNWFRSHNHSVPLAQEQAIVAHIDRTIEHLAAARAAFVADIAEKLKQPKRLRGMLLVKDHGDGLPPHNQRSQTLAALGLVKRDQLGKSLSSQKPKGD